KDMEIFEQCLQPHQKAMTSEGFTMPQKATIEHNMIAIRRLYRNIYISELAHLLGLDEGTTEKVAASMISEGRLQASLDQLEGMIYFTGPGDVEEDCRGEWIESIRETCKALNACVDKVQSSPVAANGI
ncbi:csn-4, partial [Symbiodinium microadriaticum]